MNELLVTRRSPERASVHARRPHRLSLMLAVALISILVLAGIEVARHHAAGAATGGPDVLTQDDGGDGGTGGGDGGTGGGEGGTTGGDGGPGGGDGGTTGGDGSGSESDGSSLSTEDWILLGILGVLAVAVIMGVTSAAHHHSEKKDAAKASLNGRLGESVGSARWIHDQGSMDVLRVNDPRELASTWDGVRERIIDLEARVSTLGSQVSDSGLQQALSRLGQTAAGLRGALESLVSLRLGSDAADQADLIHSARQTVDERRQQFGSAIDPVAAAQR